MPSSAVSASVIRAAANSPASASMADTTSISAAVSSASSRLTVGERLGCISSKPSCAKVLIASRTGVLETLRRSHNSRSFNFSPGPMAPATIKLRNMFAVLACISPFFKTALFFVSADRLSSGVGVLALIFVMTWISLTDFILVCKNKA